MAENEREPIGKKTRFEVFKRDKFTCQYCGQKAPDVVLQVDHIQPVAEGGANDILNLITSCQPCNSGKGKRLLTDDSVIERQRQQIEELEERRQQLEMMLRWREELSSIGEQTVDGVCDHISARSRFTPNESGRQDIRRWLKKYSVDEILAAVDEAFDVYLRYDGNEPTTESWNKAFLKIPGVIGIQRQAVDKPYLKDLFYIQGIVRNRTRNKWYKCVERLEEAHLAGASIEGLSRLAKMIDHVDEFEEQIDSYLADKAAARGN